MVAPPTWFGTMTSKAELRSILRKRRAEFRANVPAPMPWRTELVAAIANVDYVGSYSAMGGEPDLSMINCSIAETGKQLALPRVEGRGTAMTFHRWSIEEALERAAFGFAQPPISATMVEPQLLLVPMVGFDRALRRLGQGAGHYDRYFERFPGAIRIGIAWSVQEVEMIATDSWDVPMHAILTEKEWICATTIGKVTS